MHKISLMSSESNVCQILERDMRLIWSKRKFILNQSKENRRNRDLTALQLPTRNHGCRSEINFADYLFFQCLCVINLPALSRISRRYSQNLPVRASCMTQNRAYRAGTPCSSAAILTWPFSLSSNEVAFAGTSSVLPCRFSARRHGNLLKRNSVLRWESRTLKILQRKSGSASSFYILRKVVLRKVINSCAINGGNNIFCTIVNMNIFEKEFL